MVLTNVGEKRSADELPRRQTSSKSGGGLRNISLDDDSVTGDHALDPDAVYEDILCLFSGDASISSKFIVREMTMEFEGKPIRILRNPGEKFIGVKIVETETTPLKDSKDFGNSQPKTSTSDGASSYAVDGYDTPEYDVDDEGWMHDRELVTSQINNVFGLSPKDEEEDENDEQFDTETVGELFQLFEKTKFPEHWRPSYLGLRHDDTGKIIHMGRNDKEKNLEINVKVLEPDDKDFEPIGDKVHGCEYNPSQDGWIQTSEELHTRLNDAALNTLDSSDKKRKAVEKGGSSVSKKSRRGSQSSSEKVFTFDQADEDIFGYLADADSWMPKDWTYLYMGIRDGTTGRIIHVYRNTDSRMVGTKIKVFEASPSGQDDGAVDWSADCDDLHRKMNDAASKILEASNSSDS